MTRICPSLHKAFFFFLLESLLRVIDCLEKGTTEGVLLSSAVQLELRHMAKTNAS